MKTKKAKKPTPGRDLKTRIPDDTREILRKLAAESGMSLTRYTSAVLQDAAENGLIFTARPERKGPVRKFTAPNPAPWRPAMPHYPVWKP